ncbi:MAG: TIGR02453 family protein, partial [Ignavibacteria bacterium]
MSKMLSFPFNTQNFLKQLAKNNSKEWFEENREAFNNDFLQPAVQFVVDIGERLQTIVPEIMAVPKVDKSIFRLHRDVRFSKDKSPFKTNLGILLWEGKEKKQSPGFYFHIEPKLFF